MLGIVFRHNENSMKANSQLRLRERCLLH